MRKNGSEEYSPPYPLHSITPFSFLPCFLFTHRAKSTDIPPFFLEDAKKVIKKKKGGRNKRGLFCLVACLADCLFLLFSGLGCCEEGAVINPDIHRLGIVDIGGSPPFFFLLGKK